MPGQELNAGQIKGVLILDGKKFTVGLNAAGTASKKFELQSKKQSKAIAAGFGRVNSSIGKTILQYGALFLSARGMKNLIFNTASMGDQFQKAAQRVGVSAETLSEFAHAAELSGASMATVENGFRLLSKRMLDANTGLAEAKRTFDALEIGVTNADGSLRKVDDVFMDAIDSINKLGSETEKTALAQELFGRSGTQLLPLIRAGKKGLAEMRQEARNLGITFNDVQANQAAAFQDSMTRVTAKLKGLRNQIGQAVLPALTTLANHFATTSKDMDNRSKTLAENMRSAFIAIVEAGGFVAKAIKGIKLAYTTLELAVKNTGSAVQKAVLARSIAATVEEIIKLEQASQAGAVQANQYAIQMSGLKARLKELTGASSKLDDEVVDLFNDIVKQALAIENADIAWKEFLNTVKTAGETETPALPGADPEATESATKNTKKGLSERIKAQGEFVAQMIALEKELATFKAQLLAQERAQQLAWINQLRVAKENEITKAAETTEKRISLLWQENAEFERKIAQEREFETAKNEFFKQKGQEVFAFWGGGWASTTADFLANMDEMTNAGKEWGQAIDNVWDNLKSSIIGNLLKITGQFITQKALEVGATILGLEAVAAANVASGVTVAAAWAPGALAHTLATGGLNAVPAKAGIASTALFLDSIMTGLSAFREGGPIAETGPILAHTDEFVLNRMQTQQLSQILTKLNSRLDEGLAGGVMKVKAVGGAAQALVDMLSFEVEVNKRRLVASTVAA
jgi:archaellum component FlaG (FlaF/FlaG flagellin family)